MGSAAVTRQRSTTSQTTSTAPAQKKKEGIDAAANGDTFLPVGVWKRHVPDRNCA